MKKLFIGLGLFIVLNISTAYFFLFTSFGNGLVSSFIETKINEKGVVNFKFDEFILSLDTLSIKANIDTTSTIQIAGDISPFSLKLDLKYLVNITDLSKLEKFVNQKLNGKFTTNGEIKGNKDLLLINGLTDLFGSSSKYDVVLKNFDITNIDFLFKQLHIEQLLHTLNQPPYAKGKVDIEGNVTNITLENLAGKIVTTIYEGELNNKTLNETFELKLLSNKNFEGKIDTFLKPMLIDNKIDLKTSMANLVVNSAKIDLKDNTIKSDYEVAVEDLNNLYDLTQMKLLGAIKINGEIKKAKDLEVTGISNTLNGKIDFTLFNDDFNAKINAIDVVELTKMMLYPSFFDSKANAVLDYNLVTQKGVLSANLSNGQFLKNEFSTMVNTLARFDLTKEIYKNVEIRSQINKKIIQSVVAMESAYTSIEVPQSRVDLEAQTIDADLNLKIKKLEVASKITGNIKRPNIKIDASKLLENKAKEKLEEKIKEKLGDDEDMNKLIKGLKSLF
jgi:hypothetical protein